MSYVLPIRPDLEHLKNEAKAILKRHRAGDTSICGVLRHLNRLVDATDAEVLAADVTLAEVQFSLARLYGFKSWEQFRQVVVGMRPLDSSHQPAASDAYLLPNPPTGRRGGNRFARAYQMVMSYCGASCDDDTVAGDSGLAFILQADRTLTPYGAEVKELDLGWWPLDSWGALLRLDFLGRAHGVTLTTLPLHEAEYRADESRHYQRYHHASVTRALQACRPVVGVEHDIWVITGCDEGSPPLLGQIVCSDVAQIVRLGHYPWNVIVPGEPVQPMDRLQADAQSLTFIIQLHQDRWGDGASEACPLERSSSYLSGQGAFALWSQLLREGQRCGPAHYSANIVGCTTRNRKSASPYLRRMADRHGKKVADPLHTAADLYEQVLRKLAIADTSSQAFSSAAGRERLADVVDQMAALEVQAAVHIERARQAM
ncbi:MAG: hypothetical protein IT442_11610 [Phycisphaeraceae bacterium]|nr:hypothetical protein [Phycisphaeraceae bacterium]